MSENTHTIDRFNPPISAGVPIFSFPGFNLVRLSNNIKLYMVEEHIRPLFTFKILFKSGAAGEEIPGLSYITSQMLTRGTPTRTAPELAREIDDMGASLSSTSHWDDSSLSIVCISSYIEKSIEIIADCFFNSKFDVDEVERLKKKHISLIHQELADPSYLASLAFHSVIYKNKAYGHPLMGTEKSIAGISREDCLRQFKKYTEESEISIFVAGDFYADEIIKLAEKHFGSLKSGVPGEDLKFRQYSSKECKIAVVDKPDSSQTALRVGKPAISRFNPDFPLFQLASTIFSGYFLSRLNTILREERGYTYGVHSYLETRKYGSTFIVTTNISKDATTDSVRQILLEMERLASNPVSDEELFQASQYILGSFVRSIETSQQIANQLYYIELTGLPLDYYNEFYSKIATATVDGLLEVQKKYYKPENIVISAVQDADFLTKELSEFGSLYLYNFGDGRKLKKI